ncbi:hypothetical protein ACK3TF_004070 [Chlorella vulgaris]
MASPANPLGNNPAVSAETTSKYCKLFLDYKLAVNGAHFSDTTLYGGQLWEWHGPPGFSACQAPPLLTFLAAPRLSPELAELLDPAQQAQQAQQTQQQAQQQTQQQTQQQPEQAQQQTQQQTQQQPEQAQQQQPEWQPEHPQQQQQVQQQQ